MVNTYKLEPLEDARSDVAVKSDNTKIGINYIMKPGNVW